jgi:Leucine-rich repeat (LRR) protein
VELRDARFHGTLPSAVCGWSDAVRISIAGNHLAGGIPNCTWPALQILDASDCNLTDLSPGVFQLPSIVALDFSGNRIAYNASSCPTNTASGVVSAQTVIMSGNAWSVLFDMALACFVGPSSAVHTLSLQSMNLVGEFAPTGLTNTGRLSRLSVANNNLVDGDSALAYPQHLGAIDDLDVGNNTLLSVISQATWYRSFARLVRPRALFPPAFARTHPIARMRRSFRAPAFACATRR